MARVDILLATYNGARFLPAQLASLAAQDHDDWRLIVRDDGSTDESVDLVQEWAETVPQEVRLLRDDGGEGERGVGDRGLDRGLGAAGNFSRLLRASDSPYFAFCDQDDVWLPDKLSRLLAETVAAEQARGGRVPILSHCDLTVVDEALAVLHPSFWDQQGFDVRAISRRAGDRPARKRLVMRNIVTGCAMMGNASLRDQANPVPPDSVMHDWWIALVAGYLGEIRAVDGPGLLYRQHGSNSLGAKDWRPRSVLRRFLSAPGATFARTRAWLDASRSQAARFLTRHGPALSPEDAAYLEDYARRGPGTFLSRKTFLLRHRAWPQSPAHALVMLLFM